MENYDLKKSKRWSVTYTKHKNQKRKVYQDGYMDLYISSTSNNSNKLSLLDDFHKVLECKIVNDEELENVQPGETLSFHSYLVDVGDPEGGCETVDYEKTSVLPEKHGRVVAHRHKFRSPTVSRDLKENCVMESSNSRTINLDPSRKIIREFKKSELQRYGAIQSGPPPENQNSSIQEWQVLYTTQITKKAKSYHDGFLRMAHKGTFGRQAMLYDASKTVLTTRFLKTHEMIRSGESISLDGYLVEIGEPEEDRKPLVDHGTSVGRGETTNGRQNTFKTNKLGAKGLMQSRANNCEPPAPDVEEVIDAHVTEWQVLYTTQMTQKAKKYHDGFLRLANCGSSRKQIRLYDSSRNIINSRFLKKDEVIKSGESIAFDAHLVDIGEPEREIKSIDDANLQGNNSTQTQKIGATDVSQNCLQAKFMSKGTSQSNEGFRKGADFCSNPSAADCSKLNNVVPAKQPLRDACQILSILKKPMALEGDAAGCTSKRISTSASSLVELRILDPSKKYPEDSQLATTSAPNHVPNANVVKVESIRTGPTRESTNVLPSEAISTNFGNQISFDPVRTKPLDEVGGSSQELDHAVASEKSSQRQMDEQPTFDLRF